MNPTTLTPAFLREPRSNGVIPLSAEIGPVLADALEIADAYARVEIETSLRCALCATSATPNWWDANWRTF